MNRHIPTPEPPAATLRPAARTARFRAAPAVVAVVALALGACGDDGDGADGSTGAADATPAAVGEAATADEFCDAALTLETAPGPAVDFDEATEDEIADAGRLWGTAVLRPLADEVVAAAPAEVASEVEVLSGVVDQVVETGDVTAFDAPDATAANGRYIDFAIAECGWATVEVGAADYRFEGLPAELDAGPTQFTFTNAGSELHELLVLRRNEGTDQPVEELLALPEEQATELVTPTGEPAFAPPGGSEQVVHDLEAGDYIAVCFIPTGTTSEDAPPSPDAAPHVAHGMVAEFTVAP